MLLIEFYLIYKAVGHKCQTWNGTHVNPGILINLLDSFLVLHLKEKKQKTYLFYITLFDSHRPEEEDSIQIFPNVTIPFSITLPFRSHTPDFYVPVFTLAEMFCYMGKIRILPKLIFEWKQLEFFFWIFSSWFFQDGSKLPKLC